MNQKKHRPTSCTLDRSDEESVRLDALRSTGILDTIQEPSFDAITRIAAEYFHAESAGIGFADESRVWIKSWWGPHTRELPRDESIFNMVLANDGPVIVQDTSAFSGRGELPLFLRLFDAAFFASVPVRSSEGQILGALTIFCSDPRPGLTSEELRLLEGLAGGISNQLELRRLRNALTRQPARLESAPSSGAGVSMIEFELRRALSRREFVLHYQPELDLTTGRIVALEALIRWRHPERGLIPPAEFIPHAEENGLILPIGDWVLSEACNQIRAWSDENPSHKSLRVCVNLSACQFSRSGLADHIQALLLQFGISESQLGLEMTEASLISDVCTATEVLASLRRLCVCLMMDDFGTGYSSLSYLHSFQFDALKIDRSFVSRLTDGDQPLQLVQTIIELARALGMNVVAEGIETREQYMLLRRLGCRYGQGYLFARPMPAKDVTHLLRQSQGILHMLGARDEFGGQRYGDNCHGKNEQMAV